MGRSQEHLWPPGEPSLHRFWLYQDSRGLKTAFDHGYMTTTLGLEGLWQRIGNGLVPH